MEQSFFARFKLPILCVAMFMLAPVFGGAKNALQSNRNDVKEWLPSKYAETALFQWFRGHFAGDEFILVSWEGCTLEDLRVPQFAETLSSAVAEWELADGPKEPLFKQILTGPDLIASLIERQAGLDEDEAIDRLKGSLVGPDGQQTCVVLTLDEAGKRNPRKTVALVRKTAAEVCKIDPEDLRLGGPPIDNVAIDEAGEKSLYKLAAAAAGIGLAISWWCLRSGQLIFMVFSSGIYAAAASLAVVWYSGATMNAILLTMPSLVYVATISGAIHLSNYYRDTLAEHGYANAAGAAISHAKLPLTLATATTAIGLMTLYISELTPIQMFGMYSAIGVVISLVVLFLFLPAAFEMWPLALPSPAKNDAPKSRFSDPMLSKRWRLAGRFVIRHNRKVAVACVVLLAAVGYGMTRIQTSVHLMRLFPPDARILADYKWLEENLGELVPMEVVLKIDQKGCELTGLQRMQLTDAIQKRLVARIPEVGSALSPVTFAPPLEMAGDGTDLLDILGSRLTEEALENAFREHRDEYLQSDYLAEEDGRDLWRISARVGALQDVDYGLFLADFKKEVVPIVKLARDYVRLPKDKRTVGFARYIRQSFSAEFAARALAEEFPEPDANGNLPPIDSAGIEMVFTGLVPLIYKAQRSLLDGLVFGFVTDFILITIVMIFAVRSLSAGAILALPSIFPAIFVFGFMGWLGVIVDIGTVMAPSVALGVTVDDVVHFMIKFRNALQDGKNRRQAVMEAYRGCARAMYQSWGVIGLGLSVFVLSPFTPTQRFGYMMVTLLTSALVGNLLLLPALLAGPLGAFFGRGVARQQAKKEARERQTRRDAGSEESHPAPVAPRVDAAAAALAQDSARRSARA